MKTTMDLLNHATKDNIKDAEWCRRLGINRTTLSVARLRGHLTPVVAGAMAKELGLDATMWTAKAAVEAAPNSALKDMLSMTFNKVANL